MSKTCIRDEFSNQFKGVLKAEQAELKLGSGEGELKPYELLLGALGACYHHTLITVIDKKRLSFEGVDYEISGEKREEVPTTLKTVHMQLNFHGVKEADRVQFNKACELAAKYCSIHATIAQVADITTDINYL